VRKLVAVIRGADSLDLPGPGAPDRGPGPARPRGQDHARRAFRRRLHHHQRPALDSLRCV